jgi:hypothetical protein
MRRAGCVILALAVGLAGCSAVPNLDAGSAGCQNAHGIGPRPADPEAAQVTDMEAAPQVHGLAPAVAAATARAAGHTVVFNTEGVCWCEPPPDGTVTGSWWGEHGQLWLWVDGASVPADDVPFLGWGC